MDYNIEVFTPQNYEKWHEREIERELKSIPERKYVRFKKEYPDAVILFRIGDFYETYSEDAQTCADILGIILSKANVSNVEKMYRYCGFPKHALNDYLAKLVRSGKKVCVCEPIK